jgi:hypothetical protein
MVKVYDKGRKKFLGAINDDEFQFLTDHLEEEGINDDDYYLNRATLDYLTEQGITPHLKQTLETAMKGHEGVEITFKKDAGEIRQEGE